MAMELKRIELIAALLGSDRLGFYLGGDWKKEKEMLGFQNEDEEYFNRHYAEIMTARAISVATKLANAIDQL